MTRRLRILIAEDNKADLLLVEEALRHHGLAFDLIHAANGDEAAGLLEQIGSELDCPDLVLLDLNLPKMDGLEVLGHLRSHERCKHLPVIVMTSSESPSDRRRAAELRVAHYFRKPSDWDEFLGLGALVRDIAGEG